MRKLDEAAELPLLGEDELLIRMPQTRLLLTILTVHVGEGETQRVARLVHSRSFVRVFVPRSISKGVRDCK